MAQDGGAKLTRIEELEQAVESLPVEEYRRFRAWFLEHDWVEWDRQIEQDSESGKLDFLVREAEDGSKRGTLGDL